MREFMAECQLDCGLRPASGLVPSGHPETPQADRGVWERQQSPRRGWLGKSRVVQDRLEDTPPGRLPRKQGPCKIEVFGGGRGAGGGGLLKLGWCICVMSALHILRRNGPRKGAGPGSGERKHRPAPVPWEGASLSQTQTGEQTSLVCTKKESAGEWAAEDTLLARVVGMRERRGGD